LTAAIQPSIDIGDIVIPSSSVRDEGTSHHYLPRNAQATANWEIRDVLIRCCDRSGVKRRVGTLWTTDAPYRETPSKVAYLQRGGVLGVDMESSAIFSVAISRKVRAACILAASSTLTSGTPTMGMYSPRLRESVKRITQISVEAARELAAMEN
jgi:uridine phosphorylase